MYRYLCHHGIKGQKWGVRRYENYDGTLTEAGRRRYGYSDKPIKKYGKDERAYLNLRNKQHQMASSKKMVKEVESYESDPKYSHNPYDDIEFEKGSKFYRLTSNPNEKDLKRLYMTQRPDEYAFKAMFDVEHYVDTLLTTYEADSDIRLAGINTVNEILNEIGNKNIQMFYGDPGKTSSDFLMDPNSKESKHVRKRLKEKGYSGAIDPEDSSGFSSSSYIFTNKKGIKNIDNKKVSEIDWDKFKSLTQKEKEKFKKKKETVFISGSSKTQDKDSGYYRKSLPKDIIDEINSYIKNGDKILVGDAPGIDRQVQDYLASKNYSNVTVYGPGKNVRYSANKNWKTKLVDAPKYEPNSPKWLAQKDIAMAYAANKGLAIVLDKGGAKATRNNVNRLINQNKNVKIFEISSQGESYDKYIEKLIDELK